MSLEIIFSYIGWLFVISLFVGVLITVFSNLFARLGTELRGVFALVAPGILGYVVGAHFLNFSDKFAILGVIGLLYLLIPFLYIAAQTASSKS